MILSSGEAQVYIAIDPASDPTAIAAMSIDEETGETRFWQLLGEATKIDMEAGHGS